MFFPSVQTEKKKKPGKNNMVDDPVPSKAGLTMPRSFLTDVCFLNTPNCGNSKACLTICFSVAVIFLLEIFSASWYNLISLVLYHGQDIPL